MKLYPRIPASRRCLPSKYLGSSSWVATWHEQADQLREELKGERSEGF